MEFSWILRFFVYCLFFSCEQVCNSITPEPTEYSQSTTPLPPSTTQPTLEPNEASVTIPPLTLEPTATFEPTQPLTPNQLTPPSLRTTKLATSFMQLPLSASLSILGIFLLFLCAIWRYHNKFYPEGNVVILVEVIFQIMSCIFNVRFLKFIRSLPYSNIQWVFWFGLSGPTLAYAINFFFVTSYVKTEGQTNKLFNDWVFKHCFTMYIGNFCAILNTRNARIWTSKAFYWSMFNAPVSREMLQGLDSRHLVTLILHDAVLMICQIFICIYLQTILAPSSLAFIFTFAILVRAGITAGLKCRTIYLTETDFHTKGIQSSSDGNEDDPIYLHASGMENYERVQLIGEGFFGKIYKAQDKSTKLFWAVKLIECKEAFGKPRLEGLKKESKRLLDLKHCPHICEARESFVYNETQIVGSITEHKQYWCVVLKYYEQGDLRKRIEESQSQNSLTGKGVRADELQIIEWMLQLTAGVVAIHGAHMIHRDLKPANIFLEDNQVKIGDFGIAMDKSSGLTFNGTRGYYAPEVWKGERYGKKVDMYSLGVVLLDLLTLTFPTDKKEQKIREKKEQKIREKKEQKIREIPSHYSPRWVQIVECLLHEDAKQRYAATELGPVISALRLSLSPQFSSSSSLSSPSLPSWSYSTSCSSPSSPISLSSPSVQELKGTIHLMG